MYPNLYYIFKALLGVEWESLKIANTFGIMVALSFLAAGIVFTSELKRKEKAGLLTYKEEEIIVGRQASLIELIINAALGFVFGYKLIGLLVNRPANVAPQDYIFTSEGSMAGGLLFAALLAGYKWYEKNKTKLKVPERRTVRIWPHDRVGDIVLLAIVFGIIGSKLFDSFEHWDQFIANPIESLLSRSGLTFYGGLIMASIAIVWYAYKKGITLKHLADAAVPAVMIAYAVGRIGCQLAGDGVWGVYNSAYQSDAYGNVSPANRADFKKNISANDSYFTNGTAKDSTGMATRTTDRYYGSLDSVPSRYWKGPSFLPNWMFAYSFPQNVNNDGILIPGNTEDHNRVLPHPVIPTSFYETIICGLMFLFMWLMRRKIKIPLMMSALYLVLNGLERFFIESIRVNKVYATGGYYLSQAEIIALGMILFGIVLGITAFKLKKKLI